MLILNVGGMPSAPRSSCRPSIIESSIKPVNQKLFTRRCAWLTGLGLIGLLLVLQGCSATQTSADGGGKKGKKGKGGDGAPVPVEVAKVIRKDVPIDVTAVGNVEPLSTVSVRPQVSGQIEEVFIQDGQYVAKGQKLF